MKKKINIVESKNNTFYIKKRGVPKGCKLCLKGAKVVLFLNGICQKPAHCSWYCPISEERKNNDITFADEININSKEELLEEINKINAKGMSITGGEPLLEANLEKTLEYIKYIKSVKRKKFHIHLYTNGINFSESIAKALVKAGLDEIRFHPSKEKWSNIKKALNKGMSVGAEVPVIPKQEYINKIEEFIIYLEKIGVDFVNLNEFEFCFPNSQSLKDRGFILKENTIASVENSRESGIELIKKLASKVSFKIHFCSIITKDYFQLKNRYLRRAKNIKLPYETINDEGLLLFTQIEGNQKELKKFLLLLKNELKIPDKFISFKNENIKLPYYIAINDQLKSLLTKYKLKGFVVETTPFRSEYYRQVTEKTPINVLRQEVGLNEN